MAAELANKMTLSIAVIDPNDLNPTISTKFHTRVSAITPASIDFLKSINVWNELERKNAFEATKVWDQNSHGRLNFHAKDEGMEYLGYIVENDVIQSALYRVTEPSIATMIQASLVELIATDVGYKVVLNNDQTLSCKLLIGADGPKSKVRSLANIEFKEQNYNQAAIIANVLTEKPLNKTTWQRFLSDSILAFLPLSDHQASVVWSCKNSLANSLEKLDDIAFNKRITEASEYLFGSLELQSSRKYFPLVARSANQYVLENLSLIGDAAHNIHPLAGQGVNLGFSDVMELSKQLQASNPDTLGEFLVLRKYARARRLDNELMAKTMTGLDWVYKENMEPLRWLRGYGMNLIDETPALKSFFQRQALGKIKKN